VRKTTVSLPADLWEALERVSRARGVSKAEVIRQALRDAVGDPRPHGGLLASGQPIARVADEHLAGYGES
jgi:metal-responsive CopG/Arc/MetJ family transcriptional regulator